MTEVLYEGDFFKRWKEEEQEQTGLAAKGDV